jgi:hypothetical protein
VTDIEIVEALRTSYDGVELVFGTVDVTHQVVATSRSGSAAARSSARSRWTCRRASCGRGRSGTPSRPRCWSAGTVVGGRAGGARTRRARRDRPAAAVRHLRPWDIGGVSTALHPDTGECTVFVYDGHPGGAGFSEQGYVRARPGCGDPGGDRVVRVPGGCPSCVQSPKCGNGNEPLDKAGAVRLLDVVLASGLRRWRGGKQPCPCRPAKEPVVVVLGLILLVLCVVLGAAVAVATPIPDLGLERVGTRCPADAAGCSCRMALGAARCSACCDAGGAAQAAQKVALKREVQRCARAGDPGGGERPAAGRARAGAARATRPGAGVTAATCAGKHAGTDGAAGKRAPT